MQPHWERTLGAWAPFPADVTPMPSPGLILLCIPALEQVTARGLVLSPFSPPSKSAPLGVVSDTQHRHMQRESVNLPSQHKVIPDLHNSIGQISFESV